MWDSQTLAIVFGAFVVAGFVKGVIGLGLPTVSLGLLTATLGLQPAMALLIVPAILANIWQAAVGGQGLAILRRLWSFFLCATLFIWLGALALAGGDTRLLSALLGLLLIAYALLGLARPQVKLPAGWEPWLSPLVGAVNGVLTGMTGSFVVPGVLYMQAVGLGRDALIQAMGLLFLLSTLGLAVALGGHDLLTADLGMLSAVAVAPAFAGMLVGQWVRKRLSEERFKRVFFAALLLLGAYIVVRAADRLL